MWHVGTRLWRLQHCGNPPAGRGRERHRAPDSSRRRMDLVWAYSKRLQGDIEQWGRDGQFGQMEVPRFNGVMEQIILVTDRRTDSSAWTVWDSGWTSVSRLLVLDVSDDIRLTWKLSGQIRLMLIIEPYMN